MDLIAMAGGYTIDADIKNVRLIRQGRRFPINLYNIIERGDQSQNVIIDAGDIVDIPESPLGQRVYVLGAVANQGVYRLQDARDLLTALSLAGNFTHEAKEENTLIVRGYDAPGAKPLVMMADLDALLNKADVSQNIPLQDGDLVYVPRMLIADINRWIENAAPMLDLVRWPAETYREYTQRPLIKNQ
jgi:polysaccharide export outer membrane protein